jgi:DNA-binding CsgD family transcriptional regulator
MVFPKALDALYAACQDPTLWSKALEATAEYVGGLGGFLVRNPPLGQAGEIVSGRLCDALNRAYIASYSDNLWTRAVRNCNQSGPIILSSLVEERDLVRTACYADIIRPHGAIDMAILGVDALCQNGSVGGFGFPLSRRHADHADAVARRLTRIEPHLHRAFTLSLRLSEADTEHRTLTSMLNSIDTGAIVLDGTARVLLVNTAAKFILAKGRALHVNADRRLEAATAVDNRHLLAELRAVMNVLETQPKQHVLRLSDPGRAEPLTLLVVPLPQPAFVLARGLEEASIMILVLGDGKVIAAEEMARTVFGMSAAEARVAVLAAGGKSRPQVASALGISVETVKKHLQRCFTKTGTHGQWEMARLILQLPSNRG